MVITSFAEMISISAVIPFLGAVVAPEKLFENDFVQHLAGVFNYTKPEQLLLPLTIVFSVAAVVSGVMKIALLWVQSRLSYSIGSDFGISIYNRTLYQPYEVHIKRNSSEVIAVISTKVNSLIGGAIVPVTTMLSSVLMMLSIIFVLSIVDVLVTLYMFVSFSLVYGVIIVLTKKYMVKNSERIAIEQNNVVKVVQEGLGGVRDILIDNTQKLYCDVYRSSDISLRRSMANNQIVGGSPRFIIETVGLVLIAVIAYGFSNREDSAHAITILGVMALGAQKMLPVLQQLYRSWQIVRGSQASMMDALNLLEQPMNHFIGKDNSKRVDFYDNIELRDVHFRYYEHEVSVLEEISLKINKGDVVGVVGVTGSGKSTLIDVVMGLLKPTGGEVLVDGVPITLENNGAWKSHISHVPQVIFLADASIAENIAFGVDRSRIDMDRVVEVAQLAQISKTIELWDDKYGTIVGERGIRLSGGQRQRIGIARALYKQSDVIVLDEATSALDGETEHAVMDAINSVSSKVTILIVAHRYSTLKNCDQIIEIEGGKVKSVVSYEDLKKVQGEEL